MPTLFSKEVKSIIESLLFVSAEPLSTRQIASVLDIEEQDAEGFLKEIKADCEKEEHGYCLSEIGGGYIFTTRPEHAEYIEKIVRNRLNTLSQAALETIAIISYQQPITKSEIEEMRGVKCDSAINTLLDRGLIEEAGRKDTPGRPIIYQTTSEFLKYMGLKSLEELPEISNMSKAGEQD